MKLKHFAITADGDEKNLKPYQKISLMNKTDKIYLKSKNG